MSRIAHHRRAFAKPLPASLQSCRCGCVAATLDQCAGRNRHLRATVQHLQRSERGDDIATLILAPQIEVELVLAFVPHAAHAEATSLRVALARNKFEKILSEVEIRPNLACRTLKNRVGRRIVFANDDGHFGLDDTRLLGSDFSKRRAE